MTIHSIKYHTEILSNIYGDITPHDDYSILRRDMKSSIVTQELHFADVQLASSEEAEIPPDEILQNLSQTAVRNYM